jgi:alkanesulfonate monooxygenase SsuD/methylene tetrahydromethanopterin reductase-like flavin-dependent oxidoreductase (luciferase family)
MAAQIRCRHSSADEAQGLDVVARRCSAAGTRRGPAQDGDDPRSASSPDTPLVPSVPTLGERVGVRRLDGRLDDLGAVGGEHVVEGTGELAVPVANEEAVRRYRDSASLIGTPAQCAERVRALRDAGADEIACLIDFLPDLELVLEGLTRLDQLCEQFSLAGISQRQQQAVRAFLSDSRRTR